MVHRALFVRTEADGAFIQNKAVSFASAAHERLKRLKHDIDNTAQSDF